MVTTVTAKTRAGSMYPTGILIAPDSGSDRSISMIVFQSP